MCPQSFLASNPNNKNPVTTQQARTTSKPAPAVVAPPAPPAPPPVTTTPVIRTPAAVQKPAETPRTTPAAVVQAPRVVTTPQQQVRTTAPVQNQIQTPIRVIPAIASTIVSEVVIPSQSSILALDSLAEDLNSFVSTASVASEVLMSMVSDSSDLFSISSAPLLDASAERQSQADSSGGIDGHTSEKAGIISDEASPLSSPSSSNTGTTTDSLGRRPTIIPGTSGEVNPISIGAIIGIIIGILSVITVFLLVWYRSRKKRNQASGTTSISPSLPSVPDEANNRSTWVEFGGAKGSILSVKEDTINNEKAAPIYTMFSRSRHMAQGGDAQSYTRSKYGLLSGLSSGKSPLSPVKTTSNQPVSPLPINAPRPAYQQGGGTSFFARLLSNPIEPTPEAVAHKQPPAAPRTSAYTVEDSQHSPLDSTFRSSGQIDGFLYNDDDLDELQGLDDRSDYAGSGQKISIYCHTPTRLCPSGVPMPELAHIDNSTHRRPSLAWSARSLRDASVANDTGDNGDDARAASTRAPSLDLAWVTRDDAHRIAIPSWAQQAKRRLSTKSKKSAKSARIPSFARRSVMSNRSGSSQPTARSGRSSAYIPDLPSPSSLPYFKAGVPSSVYMNEVIPPSPAPSHVTHYI